MKISNEDIALAAKTLRAKQDKGLVTPQNPLKTRRGKTPWIVAAACAAGFVLGIGVSPMLSLTDNDARVAQTTAVQVEEPRATSVEPQVITQVVHDTIYQTKVVTKEVFRKSTVMAKNETATIENMNDNNNNNNEQSQSESVGCSMMCDNISYDLIASKN
ncbi:MAG: hypothetical protein IKH02_05460 [Prevotella sp.]|nr:hypothetical protein [Prevotella sp.]